MPGAPRPSFAVAFTTRIALFFARNPDEILSAHDAALKWNRPLRDAQRAFHTLKNNKLVAVHSRAKHGTQTNNLYTAGPALLEAIEQAG